MSRKQKAFVDWINKNFEPVKEPYRAGVVLKDKDGYGTRYMISGEVHVYHPKLNDIDKEYVETFGRFSDSCIDYYGDFRGGCPWIHPLIETEAKNRGLFLEWIDPASVGIYEK